eukprot:jgi/Ulvmu1/445/UM001_0452.1
MVNEQQQLLKYTQLGAEEQADAPLILARDEAACFAASEKFHALGCSTGAVYILDFQGNKIRELAKHKTRVTALAVTSTQEHVVTASKDGHIKVQSVLGSHGAWTANVPGAITCLAVPPHATDRLEEIAVGYLPGTFSLLRKSWLGASETPIHRHDSPVHDTLWLQHVIVWATDAGISACLSSGRGVAPQLPKPPQAGLRGCRLARVTHDAALAAWPHAVQMLSIRQGRQRLTGLALVRLQPLRSFTVHYRLHGISPFGLHVAVLADVSPGACRPAPLAPSSPPSRPSCGTGGSPAAAPVAVTAGPTPASTPPGSPGKGDGAHADTEGEKGGEGEPAGGGAWAISADPRAAAAESHPAGPQLQLRVVSLAGEELLQDDLDVDLDVDHTGQPSVSALAAWYPQQYGDLLRPFLCAGRGGGCPGSMPPSPRAAAAAAGSDASDPGSPPGAERLREKWWSDADEPIFLVVTPAAIIEGRPCDADDHVRWLLQRREYAAAVAAAAAAPYVRPETWQACAAEYVEHLLASGDTDGAVAWVREHLGADAEAWERVVFTFNQKQQLPVLAPHVPTARPRLGRQAYAMVAASFVPQRAKRRGGELLPLLKGWPHGILADVAEEVSLIITRHLQTCPVGAMADMQRALAELYSVQGNHKKALDIWLSIQDPCVFDYVEQFHLYEAAAQGAAELMAIDAERTVQLLVTHHDVVPAAEAVARLRGAQTRAATAEEAREWRHRLYAYLHALFVKERRATHASHDLQVELYAEFAPDQLLPFLQSSKQFHKERALQVCRRACLVREQVFILGRLGRASEALQLIISSLHDLPQAIAFVSSQGDSELWDELIALVVEDARLTGELLDQVGGQVDPVRLVRAIPCDLRVPRLTQRLIALMRRFRTMVQLKQRCNEIIDADCVAVAARLLQRGQEPLRFAHMWDRQAGTWELYDTLTGHSAPCDAPSVPPSAARFAAPQHLQELSMRAQVAAHAGAALDALHAPGTRERCMDGMHALLEPETQQAVRQEAAAVSQMCGSGLTLWSE